MNSPSTPTFLSPSPRGTILFAHGSRDPLWRKPIETVAQTVARLDPDGQVSCAFLELCEPDLPTCVEHMVANGALQLTVVPMFLGVGKHAREDLPVLMQALKTRHPHVRFILKAAIGEEPQLIELMARLAIA
jgi:sirohydrochlorin cobaltochelatase